jgi:hypothetical protein
LNILIRLEQDVKNQYAKDPYSEEMFFAIKALAEKILVVKRLVNTREAVNMIAHDYAARLWVRICDGVEIRHWTKYIMLNITALVQAHIKESKHSPIAIVISDPIDEEAFITTMYGSSNYNEYIRTFELKDYLVSLYENIKTIVLKYSNKTDIVFNRYLYLSVLANLLSERSLIGLSDEYEPYVNLIVKLVRRELYNSSLGDLNNRGFDSISKILKLDKEGKRFGENQL